MHQSAWALSPPLFFLPAEGRRRSARRRGHAAASLVREHPAERADGGGAGAVVRVRHRPGEGALQAATGHGAPTASSRVVQRFKI